MVARPSSSLVLLPIVRTFAPIVAGASKMHYRRFLAFNVIGGFVWTVGITRHSATSSAQRSESAGYGHRPCLTTYHRLHHPPVCRSTRYPYSGIRQSTALVRRENGKESTLFTKNPQGLTSGYWSRRGHPSVGAFVTAAHSPDRRRTKAGRSGTLVTCRAGAVC